MSKKKTIITGTMIDVSNEPILDFILFFCKMTFFLSAFVNNNFFFEALLFQFFFLHISIPFIFLMKLGFGISRIGHV
jgi:hypothetical protein